MTSFDVIKHFKRNLPRGYGKIGHFGTLDPFAEGVLLVATGKSARLNNYFQENDQKTYVAKGLVGVKTPSGDCTCDESTWTHKDFKDEGQFTKEHIEELVLKDFIKKDYYQRPPAFSAAKFEGKPLYEHARDGNFIEKDPVLRKLYSFKVLDIQMPYITFEVSVGSGTYIRSLFEDLCEKLGALGHLRTLKRTRVGKVTVDTSIEEDNWPVRDQDFAFNESSLSVVDGLDYPSFIAADEHMQNIRNGMSVPCSLEDGMCWLICQKRLMALSEVREGECFVKILFDEDDHGPLQK